MELEKLKINCFDEEVYDKSETCLVVFSRKSCNVCQEVVPMLADMSKGYEGTCKFYRVDVEEDKELFLRFSLKGVPQILFFQNGEYTGKLAGMVTEKDINKKIGELLGTTNQIVNEHSSVHKKGFLSRLFRKS